jgi:methionine synthase I (cobalamin-dependent)
VPVPEIAVPEAVVPVPILLDAATGTALMHGETLASIHQAHATAGAQILTTATLCAHVGDPDHTRPLALQAARVARSAATGSIAVAGAIGPHPAPPDHARIPYRELARALVDAGCDILLIETMTGPAHAATAVDAAFEVADGRPIWLAIACGLDARLLGGATIDELAASVDLAKVRALLVNCTEIDALSPALDALTLHRSDDRWLGAYPNTGRTTDGHHDPNAHAPTTLVDPLVQVARAHRLDLVGGCCGTDPAFIAALRAALHPDVEARALAEARLHRALAR